MSNVINTVSDMFYNATNTEPVDYPNVTLPPEDCAAQLDPDSTTFFNMVYAMLAFLIACIVVPYLFLCCCKLYRCVAKFYVLAGLINIIIGSLLCSILMPTCPPECGQFVCDVHKYNPGPVYGAITIVIGIIWLCKSCGLARYAKRMELEAAAEKATATKQFQDAAAAKGGSDNELV